MKTPAHFPPRVSLDAVLQSLQPHTRALCLAHHAGDREAFGKYLQSLPTDLLRLAAEVNAHTLGTAPSFVALMYVYCAAASAEHGDPENDFAFGFDHDDPETGQDVEKIQLIAMLELERRAGRLVKLEIDGHPLALDHKITTEAAEGSREEWESIARRIQAARN